MTNVEAIIVLKYGMKYRNPKNDTEKDRNEALDMAISALSENKGEWIKFKDFEEGYFHIKCSKCGQYWSIDDHAKIFKYCFNCGADMRGE